MITEQTSTITITSTEQTSTITEQTTTITEQTCMITEQTRSAHAFNSVYAAGQALHRLTVRCRSLMRRWRRCRKDRNEPCTVTGSLEFWSPSSRPAWTPTTNIHPTTANTVNSCNSRRKLPVTYHHPSCVCVCVCMCACLHACVHLSLIHI